MLLPPRYRVVSVALLARAAASACAPIGPIPLQVRFSFFSVVLVAGTVARASNPASPTAFHLRFSS
jgi:hypothetical protein